MKLWKAPVLYLGIFLVLAVVVALAAPYVVDWNRYRVAIEDFGSKLTGRTVRVEGPIAVRLFPWPKLAIDGVRIANPPGAGEADLLSAERIVARITLAGLFNGEIHVESIEIQRPVISLERMATGQWTWALTPMPDVASRKILEHVKLDKVSLTGGTVHLIDGKRGGAAGIARVEINLSAPGIAGPWRARGTGVYREHPLEIALTTARWQAGEPLKFGLRLAPGDGSGVVVDVDGVQDGKEVKGGLRVEPAETAAGKSNSEGAFRPMVFTAKFESSFDEIALSNIAIAPRDDEKGGNLLTGDARISLGAAIGVEANLVAAKFNLDAVAGAKAKSLLRQGGVLPLLESLLGSLPEGLDGKGTLKVGSLIAGGERLQNLLLRAAVSEDTIRIAELSASLPGQSQALFEGTFFVTDKGPQLAGDFAAESLDLRSFLSWAWPEGKEAMLALWTGSRGKLKLQTRLDATPDRLRLTESEFQLDDALGRGGFSYAAGAPPRIDLRLETSLADIDSFLPGGLPALLPGGDPANVPAMLSPIAGFGDLTLSLKARQLLLNGVAASGTAIDLSATAGGLELRTLEIADVSGARLDVSGMLSREPHAAGSRLSASVKAADPRGLLRLLGVVARGSPPAWLEPLGETDLRLTAGIATSYGKPVFSLDVSGKSGKLELKGGLSADNVVDWRDAAVAGTFRIASPQSSPLLKLAGLTPVSAYENAGAVSVAVSGTPATGLQTDVQADLFGARLQFQGTTGEAKGHVEVSGRAGVAAERPQALFRAMGLVLEDALVFSAESEVAYSGGRLSLTGLKGVSGGAPFEGELEYRPDRGLTGTVGLARLDLTRLLGHLYLPWNGKAPEADAPFAESLPLGLEGELWIRPEVLRVFEGFEVSGAEIGITAARREVKLAAFGKTPGGGSVALDLNGTWVPGGRDFQGRFTLPVDLAQRLQTADGRPVASGTAILDGGFTGFGRSPASVLAGLDGSASYRLESVSLGQFESAEFAARVAGARSQEDIDTAIAALMSGKPWPLADGAGLVTVKSGVAAFLPIQLTRPDADATIKLLAELGSGTIDIGLEVRLKQPPGLPTLEIAYAGPPEALSRSIDASALQAHLGFEVLQKGVSELERLQKEQRRAAEEEERARAEDAARLEAYEAKRWELRQRQRELTAHRRLREEAVRKAREEPPPPIGDSGAVDMPSFGTGTFEPLPEAPKPKAKPKGRQAKPVKKRSEPAFGPVVIVPPAEPPPQKQPARRRNIFDWLPF